MKNIKWIHNLNNKKRVVSSDSDKVTYLQSLVPRKYSPLQYQTIQLPNGRYGKRNPDLVIKMYGFKIPIELDGGVHGHNDDISESEQTIQRNDDYVRDDIIPIILNEEQLEELKIPWETYIKCATILLEPIFRTKRRMSS